MICREEYNLGIYLRLTDQGITNFMVKGACRFIFQIKRYGVFEICNRLINGFAKTGYIHIQAL